jgi:hypothetical protein
MGCRRRLACVFSRPNAVSAILLPSRKAAIVTEFERPFNAKAACKAAIMAVSNFHFHIRALLNLRELACRPKNGSNTVRTRIISLVLSTGSMPLHQRAPMRTFLHRVRGRWIAPAFWEDIRDLGFGLDQVDAYDRPISVQVDWRGGNPGIVHSEVARCKCPTLSSLRRQNESCKLHSP